MCFVCVCFCCLCVCVFVCGFGNHVVFEIALFSRIQVVPASASTPALLDVAFDAATCVLQLVRRPFGWTWFIPFLSVAVRLRDSFEVMTRTVGLGYGKKHLRRSRSHQCDVVSKSPSSGRFLVETHFLLFPGHTGLRRRFDMVV